MNSCILGDVHFRDDRDCFRATCESFLDWFASWDKNTPENNLILAGDLVERNLLTGTVVDYLERFRSSSRFKAIYICVGNHDRKKINNVDQLAYEFFKNQANIHVYEEATEVNIDGLNVLFLPNFRGLNKTGLSMPDFYSNLDKNKLFKNDYDLVVGHFSDEDIPFGNSAEVVSLKNIKTKKICLGHIHTRTISPEKYIGSVFAGKKSENDNTRAAWIWDGQKWREEKLPVFNEFLSVTYPEDLPKSKALVPIYTVLGCSSEKIALEKYGDIFIRKTSRDFTEDVSKSLADFDENFTDIKNINIPQLFDSFVTSQGTSFSQNILARCKSIIEQL